MKKQIKKILIVIILINIISCLYGEERKDPIVVLSGNYSLLTKDLKEEQGMNFGLFYKYLGINWLSSVSVYNGENKNENLIAGKYKTNCLEQDIIIPYKKMYLGIGLGYYKASKKQVVQKPTPESLLDGSYYRQGSEYSFESGITPNIRIGIITKITELIVINMDMKYNLIETKTDATISGRKERIDLSKLSGSLGVGIIVK